MLVSDILKTKGTNVVTVAPDTPVGAAVATLAEKRIGCIVVTTDGGALAGILSERDVVRTLAEQGGDVLDEPVSALMTAKVVTCTPSQTIADVMEMMTSGRFRHVPVLQDGRLAGMISIGDVVKFRLEETEEEVRQLAAYVAGG
ncbi:MAG: CBS domain-containing protein [Alphaproteobacteria bacterium]|nr:CBS domain-containing protein [Alphaproteobacteria bacterium]